MLDPFSNDDGDACLQLLNLEQDLKEIQMLLIEDQQVSKDIAQVDRRIKNYYDCSSMFDDDDSNSILMDDRVRTFVVPPEVPEVAPASNAAGKQPTA